MPLHPERLIDCEELHWTPSPRDCLVPTTSLLWLDPADMPSTTSAGSWLFSQRTQHNSCSKRWSSPASTSATHSWLDSQPLWLSRCSVSRMLQCTLFSINPNSPMSPPSSVSPTGFLLHPASDSRQWYWPPNTGQTIRPITSTLLYYISWPDGTAVTESKPRLLSKATTLLRSGASGVERTPNQCQDSRVTRHLTCLFRVVFWQHNKHSNIFSLTQWLCTDGIVWFVIINSKSI